MRHALDSTTRTATLLLHTVCFCRSNAQALHATNHTRHVGARPYTAPVFTLLLSTSFEPHRALAPSTYHVAAQRSVPARPVTSRPRIALPPQHEHSHEPKQSFRGRAAAQRTATGISGWAAARQQEESPAPCRAQGRGRCALSINGCIAANGWVAAIPRADACMHPVTSCACVQHAQHACMILLARQADTCDIMDSKAVVRLSKAYPSR